MPADITGLSLRSQLEQFAELLRGVLDHRIDVRVDVADGCPDVRVAPRPLRGALVELVANARDAMPEGGMLLLSARVRSAATRPAGFRASDGANGWVALSVADTGCGMTVEQREHAAEPGFSSKLRPRGGGCGLTRAAALARSAGGTLSICSAPGAGTVVTLYLPRT